MNHKALDGKLIQHQITKETGKEKKCISHISRQNYTADMEDLNVESKVECTKTREAGLDHMPLVGSGTGILEVHRLVSNCLIQNNTALLC